MSIQTPLESQSMEMPLIQTLFSYRFAVLIASGVKPGSLVSPEAKRITRTR